MCTKGTRFVSRHGICCLPFVGYWCQESCPITPGLFEQNLFRDSKERFIRSKLILRYAITEKVSPEIWNCSRYRGIVYRSPVQRERVCMVFRQSLRHNQYRKRIVSGSEKRNAERNNGRLITRKRHYQDPPVPGLIPSGLNPGSDYPFPYPKEARIGLRFKITSNQPYF
jgi:hypothetical protein